MALGKRSTTVLITGCSPGGIGYALAVEFHRKGCHVIATARKPEVLQELSALGVSAVALEVTSAESIAQCKAEVEKITDGKLDILINNAGRSHTIPATDIDMDDVRQTYESNLFGPMALCQAFVPFLIPTRGLIINISSVSSVVPYLFGAVYSSTKGALNVYSRALRLELKPFNIRVMVAMTGTVRSNNTKQIDRYLPANSLYMPVNDAFKQRIHFSQNNGTMATEAYAAKLVKAALKGEGYFGGLIGRTPDWFWAGGLSTIGYILTLLPPRFAEWSVAVYWGMGRMARTIAAARSGK